MLMGRDTLQVIDDHIRQSQIEWEKAGQRLDTLNSTLNGLRLKLGEQYRQLAKFRLDEISAGRLISRLDRADHTILTLVDKRARVLRELESSLQKSRVRQQELESERKVRRERRDSVVEALERQLQETKARLEQTDSHRLQTERVEQAVEVAERAAEKALQAEADRASKGKPYEDDSLFMYLWQRRYLTPEYGANRFIRSLDEWVARLINFTEARANYHMLLELPRRLKEHSTKLRGEADREIQTLQAMEKKAAQDDGISELQAELGKAEEQLHQIDDEIDTEEAHLQKLLHRQAEFSSGADEHSRKALELQVAELESEDLLSLDRGARATPRPEDDAIVARLGELQDQQEKVSHEILSVKAEQQQQQKALLELAQLRRRFRRQRYDSTQSTFPTGFGLALLLGQLMRGAMSSGKVWKEIDRAQRFSRSPEIGGFGGGGFGSGGGFGGEDFRTGGSF
jgi:chromosome segregation ATPase